MGKMLPNGPRPEAHKWSSVLASSVTQPGEVSYLRVTPPPDDQVHVR